MARIQSIETPENDNVKKIYEEYISKHKKVPEWVKVMANAPQILENFNHLFKTIMKEGELSEQIKWHLGYIVSEINKCEFCVSITKQMLEVMGAQEFNLENSEDETEIILKELAIKETTESSKISEELFDKIKIKLNNEQIIEAISVIGLFNYINRFNNSLVICPV